MYMSPQIEITELLVLHCTFIPCQKMPPKWLCRYMIFTHNWDKGYSSMLSISPVCPDPLGRYNAMHSSYSLSIHYALNPCVMGSCPCMSSAFKAPDQVTMCSSSVVSSQLQHRWQSSVGQNECCNEWLLSCELWLWWLADAGGSN